MSTGRYESDHLSNDVLVRSLDGELTSSKAFSVEEHLKACRLCQARQAELQRVSIGLEQSVRSVNLAIPALERSRLASRLRDARGASATPLSRTLTQFGWALAAAASLAVGLAYLPLTRGKVTASPAVEARTARTGSPFEVDGETFFYLPYSNPDLPASSSHVVQMRVPLSSLADAGVLVEPLDSRMATPDRAVLADVLLGLDGQPIGVHVLSAD